MRQIRRIAVVGAGQMGRGIAQAAAQVELDVSLYDVRGPALEAALARIRSDLERRVRRDHLSAEALESVVSRISPVTRLSELGACDFAIEAATESLEVKQDVFAALDRELPAGAVLASNTSSISLTKLAGVTQRPASVIGMHFMNPVPRMKLVEVVRALQTAEETHAITCELAARMGKEVITTKDMPGFVVNRMLIPFINEAIFALQEGLGSAAEIDQGARLGLNHPMGPLELADLIGLDTCLAIGEVLQTELGDDKYRPPTLLRNYVAAGWLGRKVGRGFYQYGR